MANKIEKPALGAELRASHPSASTLKLLQLRRSSLAKVMQAPAPQGEDLELILDIAARVPDHRRVTPYRFIVIRDAAAEKLSQNCHDIFKSQNPDASDAVLDLEVCRFTRAPLVVAVIASLDGQHKTPEWEQILCVGAVCQNMLLACQASGYAAQWLTEWMAFDGQVKLQLGLEPNEHIAGFVHIGTASEPPKERPRIDAKEITSFL